ncbi:MAG: hypothetical protein HHJ11_19345 [Phycicoccus sp.]|nr:hypothetical protein [Phycicoccus sp.]
MIDVPAVLQHLPPVFDLPEAVSVGLSARVVERAARHGDVRRLGVVKSFGPTVFTNFGST